MHPVVMQYIAEARVADLHRQAATRSRKTRGASPVRLFAWLRPQWRYTVGCEVCE
jgi:hypothetical protein